VARTAAWIGTWDAARFASLVAAICRWAFRRTAALSISALIRNSSFAVPDAVCAGTDRGAMIIDANELRGLAEGLAQNCVVGPAGLMKWATYWTQIYRNEPEEAAHPRKPGTSSRRVDGWCQLSMVSSIVAEPPGARMIRGLNEVPFPQSNDDIL
jgi:hypothetical protein